MAKKQTTAVQPLTGELVTTQQGKGSAKPITVQGWAEQLFTMEVGFQRTRMERWREFLQTSYNAPGDFSDLAARLRLKVISELIVLHCPKNAEGKNIGKNGMEVTLTTGTKQWPDAMSADYASRWEGLISTMNRVERIVQSLGVEKVVAVMGQGLGYQGTLRALTPPEGSGKGRPPKAGKGIAGTATAPPVTQVPEASGAQPDGAKVAEGANPSAQSPESLRLAAKVNGFNALCNAVQSIDESFLPGLLQSVANRLKATQNEAWLKLAADIIDVVAADEHARVEKYKAMDKAKESEPKPETTAEKKVA